MKHETTKWFLAAPGIVVGVSLLHPLPAQRALLDRANTAGPSSTVLSPDLQQKVDVGNRFVVDPDPKPDPVPEPKPVPEPQPKPKPKTESIA